MTKPLMFIDQFGPANQYELSFIKTKGFAGLFRYLGYYTHPQWGKGISIEEKDLIHSQGLGIGLNWEANPTSLSEISVSNGQRGGYDIVTEVDKLGAPTTVAIPSSIDFDIQPADFKVALAYYEAQYKEVGDRVVLGAYGKMAMLQFLKQEAPFLKFFWGPYAWSNDVVLPWLNAFQSRYNLRMAGVGVDEDEVFNLEGIWMPPGAAPTAKRQATAPEPAHWNVVVGWFPSEAKAEAAAKEITLIHHWHTEVQKIN